MKYRLHGGTSSLWPATRKGINMGKFSEFSMEGAFYSAINLDDGSGEDFLREVFAALEDDRKVVLKGRSENTKKGRPASVLIKIELPKGGSSKWELLECSLRCPCDPYADTFCFFSKEGD